MNTVMVWVLVTWVNFSGSGQLTLQYSPPVATKQSCEALLAALNSKINRHQSMCVQIEVVK
jgi:hypothetical protein